MDYTQIASLLGISLWLFVLILIWSVIWKGFALWKSARKSQLVWFTIFLIVNTLGLLEILYLFVFSKIKTKKSKRK